MVSIFVVETGLPPDSVADNPHSILWENAFLDVFFEAGHIVTNAPILRLDTKPQNDILHTVAFDIMDARDFGIDYMLIAMLDFNGDLQAPVEISFHIYRVNTGEKIFERQIPGRTFRSSRDEFDDIKAVARGIVPHIRQ